MEDVLSSSKFLANKEWTQVMSLLNEEIIKQIFFLSDKPRDNPVLADEVDIIQFGENIGEYVIHEAMMKERAECIKFVRSLNATVADALQEKRPLKVRE